jgi:hypothetical protein
LSAPSRVPAGDIRNLDPIAAQQRADAEHTEDCPKRASTSKTHRFVRGRLILLPPN